MQSRRRCERYWSLERLAPLPLDKPTSSHSGITPTTSGIFIPVRSARLQQQGRNGFSFYHIFFHIAGTGAGPVSAYGDLAYESQAMTRVLVIDDHSIVLNGCRRILEDAGVEPAITGCTLRAIGATCPMKPDRDTEPARLRGDLALSDL
jgi:hypothetical protein